MYKRHLTIIFLASIFLIPITIGTGLMSPYTPHMAMESEPSGLANIHARIADQGNVPFSINMFDNKSVINVNRTIAINDYGSAVLTDSININITQSFNSFNISFASDVAAKVHYASVIAKSANTSLSVTVGTPLTSNITGITTYPVIFGSSINQAQVTIVFSLTGVITNNEAALGSITDSVLPYHLQADLFYPWYSIPITKYIFTAGTYALFASQAINTKNFFPDASNIGATVTSNTTGNHRIQIYTLNHLNTINYTILAEHYGYNVNLTKTGKFIPAFNTDFVSNMTQNVSFDFYLDTMRMEYTNVESIITIDSWSAMYRTEIITIKNVGVSGANPAGSSQSAASNGVYPFRFFYPVPLSQISDISASDSLGNLTSLTVSYGQVNPGYPTNITLISVAPRVPVLPNKTTTITINYIFDNSAVMSETSGFLSQAWNVSTPLMSMFNWTVEHMTVRVIFPLLSSFQVSPANAWDPSNIVYTSTSTNAFLGFILPRPEVVFTLDNASYVVNNVINVHYSLVPVVGWFVEPSVFMFFFFILGLVYVTIRVLTLRLSPVVSSEPSKEEIPYDLIEGFVRFYQEKTALRTRMNNLELKRAQIKKADFDKQKQTLDTKVATTERELIKYTQQLSEKGSRYREAIRTLELAETEREDYLKNLNDLDKKKRQQRLRPEIYSRMKDDYTKRLKKVNSTIDHVLIDLRGLLTERK